MPGISRTQMGVVFYEDNTPELHAEQEWEHRFRQVNGPAVSEFAISTQGRRTRLAVYMKLHPLIV